MILCELGLHKWTKWSNPTGSNVQVRRCQRCNLHKSRLMQYISCAVRESLEEEWDPAWAEEYKASTGKGIENETLMGISSSYCSRADSGSKESERRATMSILTGVSTKDLVEELIQREAVQHCRVKPYHSYEVAVVDDQEACDAGRYKGSHRQSGMHSGTETGPAIIIVVTD